MAELGTISKASSQLRIAQPALTRQLQKLEHSLGVELLHRTHKGVRPTVAGQFLLDRTAHLQSDLDDIHREVTNLSHEAAGPLHLAVQAPLSTTLVPGLVARFVKEHPGVALHVVDGYSADVVDGLLTERLDVAIVDTPTHAKALTIVPLWVETLQLIGPPIANRAAGTAKKPASFQEIGLLPMVLPIQRYNLRKLIDAAFASQALKLRPALEADGPAMTLALVKAGLGYTLLPTCGCQAEIMADKFQVREISPAIHRPVSIVTRTALLDELKVATLLRLARAEALRLIGSGKFGPVELNSEEPLHDTQTTPARRRVLRLVRGSLDGPP